ncbi:MAG TPA: molybdopterin converting factor subunit 1 [Nitrososphaeraceae archaeon]|jgi:molybdopterin converting factor subunit 1|nr:molybdopterin converting factor subunit 1 [Nitrososphaeraceae archaeon]
MTNQFDPTITVKLFASSREIIGTDKIQVELSEKMTVRDLREMILATQPLLSKIQFVIAVNHKVVNDATTLNQTDEVAVLPAVSGG